MKKALTLALLLGSGLAQAHGHTSHHFTGWYLNAGLGGTSTKFNLSPGYHLSGSENIFDTSHEMVAENVYGKLGLEYLHQFGPRFVLGAQVSAGYTDTQTSYKNYFLEVGKLAPGVEFRLNFADHIEAQLTNDFALLFKLGILCARDTLFYGFVGPRWGNFETKITANIDLSSPFENGHGYGSDSESGYELGVSGGVGIQQMLTNHFQIALEYSYTDYGDIDSPEIQVPISGKLPGYEYLNDNTKIEASTNTLMLVASYQW